MTQLALHPRIAEVLAALTDAQREMDALITTIRDTVPAEQWARVPDMGGWSVTQVVEHLAIVEDGAGRLVSKLIKQTGDAVETDTTPVAPGLERYRIWDPSGRRIEAPDMVTPKGALSLEDAHAAQQQARARVIEAYRAASGRALGSVSAPHPALGPLDAYQWGHMTAQHQRRHVTQIRSILAAHA